MLLRENKETVWRCSGSRVRSQSRGHPKGGVQMAMQEARVTQASKKAFGLSTRKSTVTFERMMSGVQQGKSRRTAGRGRDLRV